MSKTTEIVTYKQNDIFGIMRVLSNVSSQGVTYFYNFAKNYSPKKISSILNNRGVDLYGISFDSNFEVVDKISKCMFNKVSNKKYVNALLFSPYYYSKYSLNSSTKVMEEQKIWLAYNALVNNKAVDVKKTHSIAELKEELSKNDVILLGVKEKLISSENTVFGKLSKVDKDFILNVDNGLIIKSIYPSIKFANNDLVMENMDRYLKKYPNLTNEIQHANKKIAQKVLAYELENQQIVLSNALEQGQKQFADLVNEYQSKANKIQSLIQLNQKLLNALGDAPKQSNDFDMEHII